MKKQSNLARLLEYAGPSRYLTSASWVFSAASSLLVLFPFLYLWKIIREVLQTAPDFAAAQGLVHNGWMAVGFALFFHNFSTFLGWVGIYLEDLYVRPAFRGKGYGKTFLQALARLAVERGCGRLEWWRLDWNQPSIDFYLKKGAEPMKDWTVYRIAGETLTQLTQS